MGKKISLEDKFFVAGSTGMAGGGICRILRKHNYGNIKNNGKIFTPTRKELNLLDKKMVEDWFKYHRPDVVILAAGKVGGIMANSTKPTEFLLENINIQTNVIETAWKSGVKRLLFLGSSCIYPKLSKQPIKEEYLLKGGLETTNEAYAIAKIAGIKLCESLKKQYGFDALSLMPTNLYGPGDNYHPNDSHVMAAFIRRFVEAAKDSKEYVTCWGSGSPLREFLHVDDLGEAVVFALENWDLEDNNCPKNDKGEKLYHLNVGTGKDISIKKLAEIISLFTGFKGSILWDQTKPDGTKQKLLDVTKLQNLGWRPTINLEKGIKETISIYKEAYKLN